MKYMKFNLIIILLFLLGNVSAVEINYILNVDLSDLKEIDKIFVYNEQLFISFNDNTLWRYSVDYNEEKLEKIRAITPSTELFNDIKDIWVEGQIVYILDNSYVYKYNFIERKELFIGDSDSYFPEIPSAITITKNGTYIYLVDGDGKITIMYEYDKNKYLSEGAISVSTHGLNAQFEEIVDIVSYDNLFYVLDKKAEKIWIYENNKPYTYVNILGKGRAGYYTKKPEKIEVDDEFIYILENEGQNITLIERVSGEKIESINLECSGGAADFTYSENKLYVLCSDKSEMEIYEVDKRTTKTKEQVEILYNKLYKEISISCELYNASFYFDVTIEDKCEEFMDQIRNYTYENNNDAFEELSTLNSIVVGYNSGTKPILDNKIEKNVSYYMNKIKDEAPYTNAKNYTATRIIWDLQGVLTKKNDGEYENAINTLKVAISRYNDFMYIVQESEEEEEEEVEEEEEEIVDEYEELLDDFEQHKKEMENYSYFDMKVIDFEGKFLENLTADELEEELEKLVNEFVEYRENYDTAQNKIEQIEIEYENVKSKLFVDINSIDAQVTCAKDNLETNPKEALVCAQEALDLMESESKKSEDNLFLGIFGIGILGVGFIVLILVGAGVYKFLKRKK